MFKGIIPLKKAKEQQENISDIINKLEKKIDPNKHGCLLGKDNKDNAENLIKNAKNILKTRRDIIKAYKNSRFEKALMMMKVEMEMMMKMEMMVKVEMEMMMKMETMMKVEME